ncbi:NmrA family NAD(P)-binding protein [Streptomyces sp. HSW2009]|uniref:NmrA family NAD(P)-binding protein n=1 Tax=Streptomyces sp. HSW2009 TaxID=3142890 RepID=UPI0032EF47E0
MTILVTTPNGAVGRYVTDALRGRGDVRFLVRSESSARALGEVAGEVVRGDATHEDDVRAALDGVDRLFLAHPFAADQLTAETTLSQAAVEAGVYRIVKLGAIDFTTDGAEPDNVTRTHTEIVELLRRADVPELTILEPDRFFQNFLPAAPAIAGGTLADPAGPGARAYVDVRDIAEVAAAELVAETPVGGSIEITGPQPLTLAELADHFGTALGTPVEYVDVPMDDAWRAGLAAAGVDPYVIDGLAGLYRNYHRDGAARIGDGVQRVLGRQPRSIADFTPQLVAAAGA